MFTNNKSVNKSSRKTAALPPVYKQSKSNGPSLLASVAPAQASPTQAPPAQEPPAQASPTPEGFSPAPGLAQILKLKPEGKVTTTTGKFDCVCFLVHCAEHDRILVTRQEGAVWMPYSQLPPSNSWKYGAIFGFCLCLTASNKVKFNALKQRPPYLEMKRIQLLRVQLPQSMRFITRTVHYFKLNPNADNFKCCQPIASHLEWFPLKEVATGVVAQLWGPELVEFARLLSSAHNQPQLNIKFRISEFSLEDAYQYLPRDPPQNIEEQLLSSIRITGNDVERLYADFLEHCFPSLFQTENSFKYFLTKYDFERNDIRLSRLFRAFNGAANGFLSFHELLLGVACMEPNSLQGEYRVRFIFRYYDEDQSGGLCLEELRALVSDIGGLPSQVEVKLRQLIETVRTSWINSRQEVAEKDFVAAVLTENRLPGSVTLCRAVKSIFAQIARSIAARSLYQYRTGCNQVLAEVLPKANQNEACYSCKKKVYKVASHQVVVDMTCRQKNNRLSQIPVVSSSFKKQVDQKIIMSQQYSLEYVFNRCSAANVTMKLIREFNQHKGTTDLPKGLLWNRKEDLWRLICQLYLEIDPLLEREFKCQSVCSPCYVIGDIHGNLEDLLTMERVLWRQVPCVSSNYLFLGDYVDRGKWGLECALYLVAFKLLCPTRVTMLRGNHEVRSLQRHYSYYSECILKYGELIGLKVWELTNRIFDKLPVCATVDDAIYCAHGGIPRSATTLQQINERVPRLLPDPQRQSAIGWEILWSDPCPMQQFMYVCEQNNLDPDAQGGFVHNVKRSTAFLFSEAGATGFLLNNMLSHIIRAHEVAPCGYVFHFGSKCVTIFSSSHYCGNDNTCGLILADKQRLRVIRLDTVNNSSATD